jgi:hypothetical protein
MILRSIALLSALVAATAQANTVRWLSAEPAPRQVVLRCSYHDSFEDSHTVESIAQRNGLVGNAQAIADHIRGMRAAEYRVSGSGANRKVSTQVQIRGDFEQMVSFRASADGNQLRLHADFPRGRGKLFWSNPDARKYLSEQSRNRAEAAYDGWKERFQSDMKRLQRESGTHVFNLQGAERPDTSSAMQGAVNKRLANFGVCETRYTVGVNARWQRSVARELGQ